MDKKNQIQALRSNGDLQRVLNEAQKILLNPIMVIDTSYNLLAQSEGINSDDPLIVELLSTGGFSHETVNFFKNEKFIFTFAQSDTVALMQTPKLKYDRMNGKLFDNDGVQVGNISVVACNKQFESGDMELVELLCPIIAARLLDNKCIYEKISKVFSNSQPFDVVQHEGLNKIKEATILALRAYNYVVAVDVSLFDPTLTHLAYFRDRFCKIQPEYLYFTDLNNIMILICLDVPLREGRHLRRLGEFFAQNSIYCGVSGNFCDIDELKGGYGEAISALNYGLSEKCTCSNFFYYDDFRVEHFLNGVKDCQELSRLLSPAVVDIQNHDAANGTQLLKTLHLYILHAQSRTITARALGLSRLELSRRLSILRRKFGIEFGNGNSVFNLHASIKLLLGN